MDVDRDIESSVEGDLEQVGSPLVRELDEVFRRHGFTGGFIYSAFALDGERWRFDSSVVIDDEIPECERRAVVEEALEMLLLASDGVEDD